MSLVYLYLEIKSVKVIIVHVLSNFDFSKCTILLRLGIYEGKIINCVLSTSLVIFMGIS